MSRYFSWGRELRCPLSLLLCPLKSSNMPFLRARSKMAFFQRSRFLSLIISCAYRSRGTSQGWGALLCLGTLREASCFVYGAGCFVRRVALSVRSASWFVDDVRWGCRALLIERRGGVMVRVVFSSSSFFHPVDACCEPKPGVFGTLQVPSSKESAEGKDV